MTSRPRDDRRARALEMHLAGATYEAIAQAVGYAGRQGAHKAVQEALVDLGRPPGSQETLQVELARLDAMLTGLWPKARRGDVAAVDRVLRIGERRAQLLSLSGMEDPESKETALDEFTKRLKERESGPTSARRAKSV